MAAVVVNNIEVNQQPGGGAFTDPLVSRSAARTLFARLRRWLASRIKIAALCVGKFLSARQWRALRLSCARAARRLCRVRLRWLHWASLTFIDRNTHPPAAAAPRHPQV